MTLTGSNPSSYFIRIDKNQKLLSNPTMIVCILNLITLSFFFFECFSVSVYGSNNVLFIHTGNKKNRESLSNQNAPVCNLNLAGV